MELDFGLIQHFLRKDFEGKVSHNCRLRRFLAGASWTHAEQYLDFWGRDWRWSWHSGNAQGQVGQDLDQTDPVEGVAALAKTLKSTSTLQGSTTLIPGLTHLP